MPPYKYSVSLLMSLVSLSSCFQHVHVWVFFLPFLLTSLLFFLSCFLEPWWRRSKEAEAQLRLPPRRSWYKLQWKRKKTKKRSLSCPVFTSYDTHYRIIIFILFFFVSTDVMDLQTCALKNIIWTGKAGFGSWKPTKVWNLSANCGRSLSSKKKKRKRLTEGSKSQTLRSARCGGRMDRNKCTKMLPWTKMHGQRGVRI